MLQPDKALSCKNDEFEAAPLNLLLSAELLQKEALHTLGENSAAVLHELRGPLQAIRAHVQLLERKAALLENTGLEHNFLPIYQGVDHINALLDQFLRLSCLSAARLTHLDIGACLEEILPLLRSMAVMRNIELSADFEPGLPGCFGDEQQLKRLVFNLFANACDAISIYEGLQERANRRRPQINLVLKQDGATIMLSVCDNGCGISEDKLEKIWQPFYTDKPVGTGLGLPGCLAIAQEHGGRLTVASKAGEGSCFILRLPIRKQESPEK